jgi:antitoxin component YwqK of YwqJK toxin-antitoxin module
MESMKKLLAAMFVALLMVGCGGPDLDDKETLDGIIAEAIVWGKLQERAKEGEKLAYAPNQETPYTGWAKEMNDNGQIEMLAQIKDGKLDGLLTEWYENGQKKLVGSLKDGKQDGLETWWYENGRKKQEATYRDGKKDGFMTRWYEDGRKKGNASYKDGKLDGLMMLWYGNGQKRLKRTFENGKLITAVAWKLNGRKCPVTNIVNGNGISVWYNPDGTEKGRMTHKNGEPISD